MRFCFKPVAALLGALMWLGTAGCGGDGEPASATPAAIDGSEDGQSQSAGQGSGSTAGRPTPDPLHPVVVIDTSLGEITVRLDREKAPLTVDNFLAYVDSGHYDQTIFHEVIKDHPRLILGGAVTPERKEKKARTPIYNEARNGLKNRRGTIAMARQADAIHSATCYFFLNLTDNELLDHKDGTLEGYGYCVFGTVVGGMDVAEKIGSVAVHDTERFERIPVEPVVIRSIRRVR